MVQFKTNHGATGWRNKKITTGWCVSLWLLLILLIDVIEGAGSDEASKKMQVPVFSGKPEDFQVWWMRFKAYATLIGFALAIGQKKEDDLEGNTT